MLTSAIPVGWWLRFTSLVVVFGGLTVPVIASFNAASTTPPGWAKYGVLIVSLAGALAAATQEAFRLDANWRLNWRTAGQLEGEAWAFALGSDGYGELVDKEAFARFADKIEAIVDDWNRRAIDAGPESRTDKGTPPPAKT